MNSKIPFLPQWLDQNIWKFSSNINAKNISGIQVTSPIIGTAYHAPEPGAKKFVEIGKKIKMIETDFETVGIDTPEDLEKAINYLKSE